jgi:hypothetical protein
MSFMGGSYFQKMYEKYFIHQVRKEKVAEDILRTKPSNSTEESLTTNSASLLNGTTVIAIALYALMACFFNSIGMLPDFIRNTVVLSFLYFVFFTIPKFIYKRFILTKKD